MRRLCPAVLVALLALPATASAVVGGRDATRPYPYMAALEYDRAGGSTEYDQVCGASLLAPDRILTAAHCVVDDRDGNGQDEVVPPQSLRVLLGTQRLDQRSQGETIGVTEVMAHPDFLGRDQFSHDVAILKLSRSATKGGTIRLASPATEKPLWAPGKIATLTGWGTFVFQDPGVAYQNQLQEVDLPMRADDDCDESYAPEGGIDESTMVCAGELHGGKDSCQGDSGGPLVVPDATGALIQVGVVSWGTGCGFPTRYGIYARVGDSVLYDWIDARVPQPEAPAPPPGGGGGGTGGGGTDPGGGTGGGGTGGGSTTAPPGTQPAGSQRSAAYRRCVARASRVRGITRRRRAHKRCHYAERRRVAYRRCVKRGTSRARCRAQRRAQARRHARLVRRTR